MPGYFKWAILLIFVTKTMDIYHLPPNNVPNTFFKPSGYKEPCWIACNIYVYCKDTFVKVSCKPFKRDCRKTTTQESFNCLISKPFTSSACYQTFSANSGWLVHPRFKIHPKWMRDINICTKSPYDHKIRHHKSRNSVIHHPSKSNNSNFTQIKQNTANQI